MFTKTKQVNEDCAEDIFCGVNIVPKPEQAADLEKNIS